MPEELEQEPQAHVWERKIDLGDGSGVQVFRASSAEELVEKLAKAQENATRKIRELNQRLKLGSDGKEPEKENLVNLNPRNLSEDERWRLGSEMNDPAKASQAVRQLIEAEFGAPIEDVRKVITKNAEDARNMRAKAEAEDFVASTPEYYPCPENTASLIKYLEKNGYACTKKNLEIAFDDLHSAGLLREKPEAQPVVTAPNSQPEERIDSEVTVRPRRTQSTGLRSSDTSSSVVTKLKGPSALEIANMSAEEYKQRILLPEMASRRNR